MSASTPERGTPSNEDPWCWQSKAALERIRQALDGKKAVTSALAVYLALCEIASDEEGHTFSTTHAHIASRCGLSVRTVAARLKDLASIALVAIVTPQRLAPSTYTLLSFGNDCRTIRNGCRTFGNGPKQVTLPRSEEKEEKEEKGRRPRLTTADRISIEKAKRILEEEIEKLEDETHYEHDRRERPGLVAELKDKRQQLADINTKLLGGVA